MEQQAPTKTAPAAAVNNGRAETTTTTTTTSHNKKQQSHRYFACSVQKVMGFLLLHGVTLTIYAIPMFFVGMDQKSPITAAVLDELHIVSEHNRDVNGDNDDSNYLRTIFTNDYWGRPLHSPSSHKSWRPVSVLSFRYLRGGRHQKNALSVHRLINVVTHAAVAELVGILAVQLLVPITNNNNSTTLLRVLTKLAFALHPTHVEVTANAANRPHLLAVLCSLVSCCCDTNWLVFGIAVVLGFLSCETFLFQTVPIAVTMVAITYVRRHHHHHQHHTDGKTQQQQQQRPVERSINSWWWLLLLQLVDVVKSLLPRLLFLGMTAVAYYTGRWYYDTLSIPTGLIRPAENPFFDLTGWTRVYSYAYVLALHMTKQWDCDVIGFSHEYGYDCVPKVVEPTDPRLLLPVGIVLLHVLVGLYLLYRQCRQQQQQQPVISVGLILFVTYLSWTVTLFPVSGIVKVGTFIADRIVVASTVPVAIMQAYAVTSWLTVGRNNNNRQRRCCCCCYWYRYLGLTVVTVLMWKRIHQRTLEWMDSLPLLQSSLRTCPRFAKAHVEISKIYSGLYPAYYNLTQSRWHLQQAEAIDGDFCDVHQQFAHIAVQEHNYPELEERLLKSLMCPYTMQGAIGMWQQYWKIQLDASQHSEAVVRANQERYQSYQAVIDQAIADEAAREEEKSKEQQQKSPFAWK